MITATVPGFIELFGVSKQSYAEYLVGIPSDIVINAILMLNNELNAPIEEEVKPN